MFIRSQDKTIIVNTELLYVGNINDSAVKVITCVKDDAEVKLGTYNSEERALEVLDMIENRIIKGSTFDFINKCKRTTKEFVFKMPQE